MPVRVDSQTGPLRSERTYRADLFGAGHERLAVEKGSTENATLVTGLITGLRDRGLDVTRPILAVLDGPGRCPARSRASSTSRLSKDASGTRSKR